MATIRPVHSAPFSLFSAADVNSRLTNNYAMSLGVFDTNTLRISDMMVTLQLGFTNSNSSSFVGLYMVSAPEPSLWPGGYDAGTLSGRGQVAFSPASDASAIEIAICRVTPTMSWCGMLSRAVGTLPPYFALLAYNRTGFAPNSGYSHKGYVNYTTYEYA